jgi:hypothetical protein
MLRFQSAAERGISPESLLKAPYVTALTEQSLIVSHGWFMQ